MRKLPEIAAITFSIFSMFVVSGRCQEWYEYLPLDQIPEKYGKIKKYASKNIYFTKTPIFFKGKYEIIDINKTSKKRISKIMNNLSSRLSFTACKLNNINFCPISNGLFSTVSTSFALEDRIYTCRHPFDRWLNLISKYNKSQINFKNLTVPMELYNKEGKIIYSVLNSNSNSIVIDRVYTNKFIDTVPFDLDKNYGKTWNVSAGTDIIVLKNNILPVNNEDVKIVSDQDIYRHYSDFGLAIGYPAPIKNRNGSFEVRKFGTLVGSIGISSKNNQPMEYDAGMYMTYTSSGGLSGSPVFSSNGDILGVNCFGLTDDLQEKTGKLSSYSVGTVIYADAIRLDRVWNAIDKDVE